ncbi:tetratricopeptide repeat protein, partial [Candidatus Dependentiae bacterium]|nr:tetratricopeptide repeat protein [Candidatus Dependentiae bacterium]
MKNLIPKYILKNLKKGKFRGKFNGGVIFIDIIGFTRMTEKLMKSGKEGAEILSGIINDIFTPIIDIIYSHNGFISTYSGDAFTAIFEDKNSLNTILAAASIKQVFKSFVVRKTRFGTFNLSGKIGISYGSIDWGIIGDKQNRVYFFRGEVIKQAVEAQELCKANQIIFHNNVQNKISKSSITFQKKTTDFHILKSVKGIKRITQKKKVIKVSSKLLNEFFQIDSLPSKITGEFREVVSVFVSFEEIKRFDKLERFLKWILNQIQIFGGYFSSIEFAEKGPHMFIVFGAPTSHENDLVRALNFIHSIISRKDLNIKAGITIGTAFAGFIGSKLRETYTVLGDIVNLSARIMTASDWGEIWVPEIITRKIKDIYEIELIGKKSFKGKKKKTKIFKILSPTYTSSDLIYKNEIVGREDELNKLIKFSKPIFSGKSPGIIYIYGDPGIGKSRLIHEFVIKNKNTCTIFHLKSDEILRKSFNPFTNLFREYFNQVEETTDKKRKKRFDKEFNNLIKSLTELSDKPYSIINELFRIKSFLGALSGVLWENTLFSQLEPKDQFQNLLYGVKTFFKAQSLLRPVIIYLDDLQWLDPDSKTAFKTLSINIEDFPIMLVASSRFNDDGSKPILNLDTNFPVDRIALEALKSSALIKLINQILQKPVNTKLLNFIIKKTQSNPFYIEQICLYLKEKNVIRISKGKYILTKDEIDIPNKINTILISRIDRLSIRLKDIIKSACILGMEFEVNILSEMLKGEKIEPDLIRGENERVWFAFSELKYIFRHSLLKDAIYNMQLKSRLRQLHKLAAESLRKLFNDKPERCIDIGTHYERAELIKEAKEFLLKAAEYSNNHYKNTEALTIYNKLLTFSLDTELKIDILLLKGEVLYTIGKWKETEDTLNKSLKLSRKINNHFYISKNKILLGSLYNNQGKYAKAKKHLFSGLEYFKNSPGKDLLDIHQELGLLYYRQRDFEKTDEFYSKGLRLAKKTKLITSIGTFYSGLGLLKWKSGDFKNAISYFKKSLRIGRKLSDKKSESVSYTNIGNIYLERCEYEKAKYYYSLGLKLAEEIGDMSLTSAISSNIGAVFFYQSDHLSAIQYFEINLEIYKELGDIRMIGKTLGNLGSIYGVLGEYEKALEFYFEGLKIAERINVQESIAVTYGNIGEAYKLLGKTK